MGFNPRLAPYSIVTEIFDADPAADKIYQILRFPTQGKFLAAYITNDVAVATVTNTVAAYMTKYSSAATPVLQGTLASFAANATWAADIPKVGTKTAFGSTALFASGEHIRLSYDEVTTGLLTDAFLQLDYVLGYDTGETPTAGTGPA